MPGGWTMKHNGTDWSEGTPSRYDGRAAHDVAVDKGGYVWFADDATPNGLWESWTLARDVLPITSWRTPPTRRKVRTR